MKPIGNRRQQVMLWGMFGVCAAFFCFLTACVPLSSDDFEFLSVEISPISSVLRYALYYGNGRLLGNLGSVCLAQLPVLSVAVKALLISGIIFMVPALLGLRSPWAYLLSFLMFVAIPASLFGEVYTWTSGFQNYIPPIWTTLVILLLIQSYDRIPSRWLRTGCCVLIFLLGVAGQLYVEHTSLTALLLSGALVFRQRKVKKSLAPCVVWLLAAALGTACMLAIPKLFFMAGNRTDAYRAVNIGGIRKLLRSCVRSFAQMGNAFPCTGVLLLSCLTVITTRQTRAGRGSKGNALLYWGSMWVFAYSLLNALLTGNPWYDRFTIVRYTLTACNTVLAFALWCLALYPLEDKALRNRLYGLLALAVLPLVPLLVVTPTPDRVVFQAYLWFVAALLLCGQALTRQAGKETIAWYKRSLLCAGIAAVLVLSMVFANIGQLTRLREAHIRQEMAVGSTEIFIYRIPYGYVFWDGLWCYGKGYYYEQPNDISFRELEFPEWHALYFPQ